jgi:DNA-binding response OmpR family regulator
MAQVLIIDDEPDGCEAVVAYLRRADHDVRCARGGRAALSAILEQTPDAILLDLLMPDMDGFAVLATVRAYLRWSTVPVAIFTAIRRTRAFGTWASTESQRCSLNRG